MAPEKDVVEAELRQPHVMGAEAGPEPPYPLCMEGKVISGFGRGSKELGIPTANLPVDSSATPWIEDSKSGVYFGYASLALPGEHPDYRDPSSNPATQQQQSSSSSSTETAATTTTHFQIYPMVMSIGYNPFYKNTVRSAEVHILHKFGSDFYGAHMRLLILGYVRDELDYSGLEALIRDINVDCDIARISLARETWRPREGVIVQQQNKGEDKKGEDGGAAVPDVVVEKGGLDGSWLVRPLGEAAAAAAGTV